MAKERKKKKNEISIASEGTVEQVVEEHSSTKKKKKKKNRENSGEDEEIAAIEGEKLDEDVLAKKKSVDAETDDDGKKSKKKIKEKFADSEGEDVAKKSKKKHKKKKVDLESDDDVKKSKKKHKKTKLDSEAENSGNGEKKESDGLSSEGNQNTKKRKRDGCVLGAEENTDMEIERKSKKKKKPSVDSELEETSLSSSKDAKKKKPSENSETAENNKDSTKDANKEKKKKKKKNTEAEEKDKDSTKDAKKKRKEKQKCSESDKDVTTPSSKSTKKVKFSDQVEVFPAEDEESEEEDEKDAEEEEVELVRGKRFSKEEDALIKQAVLEYIDNHALGDKGLEMVLNCKAHPEVKGCWKEIGTALPWRPYTSVYFRAHTLFEEGSSKGVWTEEDLQLVKDFHEKHGNDWKTLAEAMGKHRVHVKDAWRRTRFNSNKGHWSRQEYQSLFDLVNKDIRMKAFKDKHSRHGMLRDNIPWMAVSDELGTRNHLLCCQKWYDQLLSPMVVEGTWANVDDYRLLEELMKLDAACIDDVDWDYLLDNRDGEACRKRWNQMIHHIGTPGTKTFAEQVEILSERYCPDLAEDREDFDNRPYDPED